ncbi:hypothetical protein LINGRAHAP2_LOCUS1929 [Linum grandiflorum]
MIMFAWSCRGLGNHRASCVLGELVKVHQPDVVFLSKTLVDSYKMNEPGVLLKFDGCFSVSGMGRSGGLSFFMKEEIIQVSQLNNHFIDIVVRWEVDGGF